MAEYLEHIWYMAAWAEEVDDALLSRTIAGRRLLLTRREDGKVAALADRCPHRFAPLSMGMRDGDMIRCRYHGLGFDLGGTCVHNPFGPRIPAGSTVPAMQAIERDGIIWVWLGDANEADISLIPDFGFLQEGPSNRVVRGYMPLAAPYEYGTDNLMDLSHIEFVHQGTFGGGGVIFAGKHSVVQEGDTLHSNWWMPSIPAPSMTAGIYPPDMMTDHWLDMRWNAPAVMFLQAGATPAGAPREEGIISNQAHIVMPEKEQSSHYFWATCRSHDVDSAEVDDVMRTMFVQAFHTEDKPVIEAAYDNVRGQDFWSQRPLSLGVDAGGARARRQIEAMRRREQAHSANDDKSAHIMESSILK